MLSQWYWGAIAARLRAAHRARAGRGTTQPAPAAPAAALPAPHMLGGGYTTADGLRITVVDLRREETEDPPCAGAGARLTLRARVENPTERAIEFDNLLGVLDGAGNAHPRGYADPARCPSALPGLVTLAPGTALEGDVYVAVDTTTPQPLWPAYLIAMMRGCAGCPSGPGVDLVPLARWQPVRL